MNEQGQELLNRLRQFAFDEGSPQLTFAARLARENGWSMGYAQRAIEEYRRFVFLAMTAGHTVTPSDQVDQVWHLHLTYTHSYWDQLCGEVLKQPLHHGPTKGGTAENAKYETCYAQTLASYRQTFAAEPPADLWPPAAIRFGTDTQQVRVNTAQNWVLPKPRWPRGVVASLALLPVIGFVPLWANGLDNIIVVAAVVFFCVIVAAIFRLMAGPSGGKRRRRRRGKNDSGCSFFAGGCGGDSGCTTGGDSGCASSGCGASCGGGCGGGCGD